jgi:flagellar basal-body rod protein FlgB
LSWLTDPATRILAGAMDGLAQRQALIASNVANIDTPGYAPQSIDFESTLRAELEADGPGMTSGPGQHPSAAASPGARLALRRTDPRHQAGTPLQPAPGEATSFAGSTRNDGNQVDLESELSAMAEGQLRYSAVARLLDGKLQMLRDVTRAGG